MKKIYIQPTIEQLNLKIESLLNTDSSGIYSDGFGAKPIVVDLDAEEEGNSYEKADWTEGIEIFPKVL